MSGEIDGRHSPDFIVLFGVARKDSLKLLGPLDPLEAECFLSLDPLREVDDAGLRAEGPWVAGNVVEHVQNEIVDEEHFRGSYFVTPTLMD